MKVICDLDASADLNPRKERLVPIREENEWTSEWVWMSWRKEE
jgi:hypothetical protein